MGLQFEFVYTCISGLVEASWKDDVRKNFIMYRGERMALPNSTFDYEYYQDSL
jgi:hypothetical protein